MAVISTDDVGLTWIRFGSIPLIVTLVLPLILGVFILLKCILNHLNHCCVRKTTTKEEMYGLEGRMTILPNVESSFVPSQPHGLQQQQALPITSISSQTSPVPNINANFQQIKQPKRQQKCDNRHSLSSQPSSLQLKNDDISNGTITIPISPTPISSAAAITTITTTTTTSTIPGEAQSDSYETVDLSDSLKRSTFRQLPELPQLPNLQVHNPPRRSSSVLSHDGTSELYATVGEEHSNPETEIGINNYYNAVSSRKSAPVHSSSRGSKNVDGPSTSRSSTSHNNNIKNSKGEPTPSSDSETYSGVNAVNHPYAKLKRNVIEHPYARVRTGSTGGGGDEETDTDNYDMNYDTPQPYAQTTRTRNPPLPISSSRPLAALQSNNVHSSSPHGNNDNIDGISQPSPNSASANNHDTNPVPPRRTSRQWRRSSHPQAQPNNDNQPNFSGDSQDSRGYTSISVREPLSNIIANRSQVANTRNYDSHYATVSDDSEEMYAAIEDSDGNYMRIPGEDGNRHWLGGPHLASPIPERREANSPLPPPPIKPPEISPTAPSLLATMDGSQSASSSSQPSNPNPPLYAQVTKKNKKGNATSAPPTNTIPSSSQQANNNNTGVRTSDVKGSMVIPNSPSPASSGGQIQASSSSSTSKNRHTVSENTAALLSPVDPTSSEPRRWSKADISYSEFEVVREPLFSQSNISRDFISHSVMKSSSSSSTPHHHTNHHHHHNIHHISTSPPPPPLPQHQQLGKTTSSSSESKNLLSGNLSDKHKKQEEELLDEDNYNVIPEPGRPSRPGRDESRVKSHSSKSSTKKVHKIPTNSDNYQEIDDIDFHSSNAYQEIERKEPSDYYQEIGASAVSKIEGSSRLHRHHQNDLSSNLYQEIDKKTPRSVDLLEDEEEDPADQLYESNLYETVKPTNKSKFTSIPSPSHSQVSMSSLDRKHGYEKLRKKVSPNPPPSTSSGGHQKNEVNFKAEFDDDDASTDDDEEDIRDATKWSKKTTESSKKKQRFTYEDNKRLTIDSAMEDDEDDDDDETKNEDLMYERVKYPPYEYERLKESRDDLRDLDLDEADSNDKNLYEHIGYSRVMKPKSKKKLVPLPNAPPFSSESSITMPSQNRDDDNQLRIRNPSQRLVQDIEAKEFSTAYSSKSSHNQNNMMVDGGGGAGTAGEMDLDQLYARVDKTKKRKHNIDSSSSTTTNVRSAEEGVEKGATTTTSSAINFSSSSSSSRVIEIKEDKPHQACILLRTDRDEEEDNSIEYI